MSENETEKTQHTPPPPPPEPQSNTDTKPRRAEESKKDESDDEGRIRPPEERPLDKGYYQGVDPIYQTDPDA